MRQLLEPPEPPEPPKPPAPKEVPARLAQPALPGLDGVTSGRYRHYKGGEYEVVGTARHSETLEPLVVYRPLYGAGGLWVRPHAMFFENVLADGRWQPRFAVMD